MTRFWQASTGGHPLGVWALLVLSLLTYGLLHIPWLGEPTFNDEAFCYYPGILHQWAQGLGMLPSSVPLELSRGHPTFFFFVYGLWAQLVGSGIEAMRVLSLLLTLAWLAGVWVLAAYLTTRTLAWATLLLLMLQPLVFAQSTLILPEILIALLFTGMFYAWLRQRWLAYVLWGVLLAWTKETTLALFPLLLLGHLLQLSWRKEPLWRSATLRLAAYTLAPLLAGLLYLLLQKLTWGFWLFPQHRGVMIYQDLAERFLFMVGPELWGRQGRWWWAILWIGVPLMRVLMHYKLLPKASWPQGLLTADKLALFALLILMYVAVHSPFLVVMRYFLCLMPLFLLGGLQLASALPWRWCLPGVWAAGMALAGWQLVAPDDRVDEVNLNYAQQNACDRAAVAWLQQQGLQHAPIYTQLVFRRKLVYPYNGYVRQPFTHITLDPEQPWDYYVVTADFATRWQWHMYRDAQELTHLPGTRRVWYQAHGHAWVAIYARIK